jgi:undecaprenyl diphosphate synthase
MLMSLFLEALRREVAELHKNDVRLRIIGERGRLDDKLREKITKAEALTAENTGLRLQIAVAYGGRWDIVAAARRVAARAVSGDISAGSIDEATFAAELQLGNAPDPDLLIRTGGEQRISNFLLWNLAYAELWFTDILWPDFGETDFEAALAYFAQRQRRFGHTGEQLEAVKC